MDKKAITSYLLGVKDFLIEIISVSKGILNLVWNNRIILSIILIVFLGLEGVNYIAYEMPKRTIFTYFRALDNRELGKAWNMLIPEFQVRWKDGEKNFKEGYSTLTSTKIISVKNLSNNSLLNELSCDKKQLEVQLIIVENFRKIDVIDSTGNDKISQADNLLWLRLKHKDGVDKMRKETLSKYSSTLKLVRRYKKIFTIQKETKADFLEILLSNNWLVADVDNKEISLIYDTTYYDK